MWPDFGDVEDVPAEFFGVFGVEDLDFNVPARIVSSGDGVEKILGVPVWTDGGEVPGFFVVKGLVALVLEIVRIIFLRSTGYHLQSIRGSSHT